MSYQAFPKSTGPIPDGYILTYSAADGYMKPTSLSRNVAIDSNTAIYWAFDETAAPFANSGAAGSLNLTAGSGSIITVRQGVFNLAVNNGTGATNGLTSGNTTVGESNSITVSCWVYLKSYANNYADIVVKQYRNDGTWTSPYSSVQLQLDNSGNGGMQFVVNVGGSPRVFNTLSAADKLQLNKWYFLALTYDASTGTLSAYINGDLVGTATGSAGNIDWGTHGAWCVLGNPAASNETLTGIVDDVRVESTVRSQAYLQTIYRAGAGLQNYGASLTITPNSAASGDLSGTYPNPTVAKINGNAVALQSLSSANDGYSLMWNNASANWQAASPVILNAYAARPSAGTVGRLFIPTDGHTQFIDDGSAWRPMIGGCVVGYQPPSAASFTSFNQGTASLVDSNGALLFTGVNDGTVVTLRGFTTSFSGGQTLVETCVAMQPPGTAAGSTFSVIGVMLRESSSSKAYLFSLSLGHNSLLTYIETHIFSGNTNRTVNTPYAMIHDNGNAPLFIRLRKDATNIYAEWSRTRVSWTTVDTRTLTSVFTTAPDQAGIAGFGYQVVETGYILHYKVS